ncbi:hypothetical protein AERO8C_120505 [Aeromonas veronii]|uniref:Uncharacterized protein n=1 Tax=Aeromonas veronii TaxID=654 RepID=A0A653KSN9_AERVE|nr:hypothetical protein AERO8C_120505 [Aeromonas veronii]
MLAINRQPAAGISLRGDTLYCLHGITGNRVDSLINATQFAGSLSPL